MKKAQLDPCATDPSVERMFFRNLMHHTTDAVYFKDRHSRYLAISDAHARLYGLDDPAEAIGKTDFDYFTEEHAQQAYDDEQQIIATGIPILNKEEKETWPDGHESWASTTKIPLLDEEGAIIGTFGISRDITERKNMERDLQRSEENLRLQNRALEEDLDRARAIQSALLPSLLPVNDRLEMDCRYCPLEAIGGDYFSFFPLKGHSLGVFIGDLMGHGVSAALFMALIKFLTDSLAQSFGHDTKHYLENLNRKLMNQMPATFITAIYGCFEFPESRGAGGRLIFSGAGHPEPILQKHGTGETRMLPQQGNAAIGIIKEFETEPTVVNLEKGDRVFLYTDGMPETMNEQSEMIGEEALLEIVARSYKTTLTETLDAIFEEIHRFRGEADHGDDILMIGFEVR